jgi:transposase
VIALAPGGRVYLACGVTDMRKGMVGLAMLVQQGLGADPLTARVSRTQSWADQVALA